MQCHFSNHTLFVVRNFSCVPEDATKVADYELDNYFVTQ